MKRMCTKCFHNIENVSKIQSDASIMMHGLNSQELAFDCNYCEENNVNASVSAIKSSSISGQSRNDSDLKTCDCKQCPVSFIEIYSNENSCPMCLQTINLTESPIIIYDCGHWVCLICYLELYIYLAKKYLETANGGNPKCVICRNYTEGQNDIHTPLPPSLIGGISIKLTDFSDMYTYTINIDANMNVRQLRMLVNEKLNVPELTLVFNGILIEDENSTMKTHGITQNSTIHYALIFK
jgi:ubiquitin domain-containing protein